MEKVIKFTTKETVIELFNVLGFRTETDQKKVKDAINLFLNMAVSARKKGKIKHSNKLIEYAICLRNCFWCAHQAAKKNRKIALIKEEEF